MYGDDEDIDFPRKPAEPVPCHAQKAVELIKMSAEVCSNSLLAWSAADRLPVSHSSGDIVGRPVESCSKKKDSELFEEEVHDKSTSLKEADELSCSIHSTPPRQGHESVADTRYVIAQMFLGFL